MQTSSSTSFFARALCALALVPLVASMSIPGSANAMKRDASAPACTKPHNGRIKAPHNDGSVGTSYLTFGYGSGSTNPAADSSIYFLSTAANALVFTFCEDNSEIYTVRPATGCEPERR